MFFSSEQLHGYKPQLSHHSDIAFERTGCYGVAESAALALAEQLAAGTGKTADFATEICPGHPGIGLRCVRSPIIPAFDHEQSSSEALPTPFF